jgi:putative flavoprotein involved in K+ transport
VETSTDILVIGAGQSGLALGHHLARAQADFLLVDAQDRLGDAWRNRWDSLRLFTPRRYDGLPGLALPGDPDGHPGKDEVADYLERYAAMFDLPVHTSRRVTTLRARRSDGFTVDTTAGSYRARQVVVATGPFTTPFIPSFAQALDLGVAQLHSSGYRNPGQVRGRDVLVVGGGNTGVQITDELDRAGLRVTLAVSELGPALPQRLLGRDLFWWFDHLGLMSLRARSWLGQRLSHQNPIIGTDVRDLLGRIALAEQVVGATEDRMVFGDGRSGSFDTVVWATGYRPHYPWLHVPVLDAQGSPEQEGGRTTHPGLTFLGLPWQHDRGSALLGWVARDAERLARHLTGPLTGAHIRPLSA